MSHSPSSSSSSSHAAQQASSHLPNLFFQNAAITRDQFDECFEYLGNGIFQLAQGWSLPFTHAVLTTGDRATNLVTDQRNSAGNLWSASTGHSITTYQCCVYNCPNQGCTPDSPQRAGATAHVYATFQLSQHDISYMILLPTCSTCNNWLRCLAEATNFPLAGDQANVLYTFAAGAEDSANRTVQLIFIQANDTTIGGKGRAGKGTGKGGICQPNPSDGPPGSKIIIGTGTHTSH